MQEMWARSLGSGRSRGGGRGNPLQYSCQENSMDRGYWRLRSTESDTTELTKHSPAQMTLQLLTSLKKDTEWPLMAEEFTGPGSRKAQECILRIDSFTDRRPRREAGKMEASTNKCHFLKLNVILQKQSFIYSTYSFICSARLHCLYHACLSLCCWRQRPWPSTHSSAR